MMEKEIYWKLECEGLSEPTYCENLRDLADVISCDINDIHPNERHDEKYTVTALELTEEEWLKLTV